MVRTLAHFSISLEEMNEQGENAGDEGGEKDGGGEDPVDPFRNKRNGNTGGSLDGNGLCAGSPNGEVEPVFSCLCNHPRPPPWTESPISLASLYIFPIVQLNYCPTFILRCLHTVIKVWITRWVCYTNCRIWLPGFTVLLFLGCLWGPQRLLRRSPFLSVVHLLLCEQHRKKKIYPQK